jgi:hypothetical protein
MKGFKIIEIIKVLLENILLELYFNVELDNKKFSFKLGISDDGETICFDENPKWISLDDISYEFYSVVKVSRDKDDLAKLLENEIINIQYGVGKTLDTNKDVIYFIKINTNKNEFLFFNNGDKGYYSFDKIEEILANDIYGYQWIDHAPHSLNT